VQVTLQAPEVPFTFDAGFAVFAGLDAVVALAVGLARGPDEPLVARVRTDVLGEGGVEVGTIVAVATVEQRRTGHRCVAQLGEAQVAMEVGERITSIGARAITAVPKWDGVALLAAATIGTTRGRDLSVLTTAYLVGVEAGAHLALVSRPTKVSRAGIAFRFDEP
jgi:hypothetical protein